MPALICRRRFAQVNARAVFLCEQDNGGLERAPDLSHRARVNPERSPQAFQTLDRGDVDAGPFGEHPRGPAEEAACGAYLC